MGVPDALGRSLNVSEILSEIDDERYLPRDTNIDQLLSDESALRLYQAESCFHDRRACTQGHAIPFQ